MTLRKIAAVSLLGLVAAGCSTGIVPTEQGKYMISTTSGAGAFGNPDTLKAEQYAQANEFCAKQGQVVESTGGTSRNGVPFVRAAGSSLEFKCVPKISAAASSPQ